MQVPDQFDVFFNPKNASENNYKNITPPSISQTSKTDESSRHRCCLALHFYDNGNHILCSVKAGISPLGYWQKDNQSPTQTKPYNTLPPFEQRDSWSSYGAVRAYSDVLL